MGAAAAGRSRTSTLKHVEVKSEDFGNEDEALSGEVVQEDDPGL